MNLNDLPMGFTMALSQQPKAAKKFANMPDDEKNQVLSQLQSINSKKEMWSFVTKLAQD